MCQPSFHRLIRASAHAYIKASVAPMFLQSYLVVNKTRLEMKLAIVCLIAIGVIVCARPQEYTHRYDNIDVDQILHNDRLLKRYIDCMLDKPNAKCPAEAIELKKVLSEALETECAKCSDHQKELVKKVIKFLVQNKHEIWVELKVKYDPDGKYTIKYEEMAREEGVQL